MLYVMGGVIVALATVLVREVLRNDALRAELVQRDAERARVEDQLHRLDQAITAQFGARARAVALAPESVEELDPAEAAELEGFTKQRVKQAA